MEFTINDVLFFDTETTGVPDRSFKWDVDYMAYPHIVQIAWIFGNKFESHIIRPEGWEIPQSSIDVHGITNEYALEHGESFSAVVDTLIQDCHNAALICGHNIHFDTSIVKANILRELGREYYDANDVESALFKGKRIDTMRPTMKWVDARMANGRLKFPNLSELYSRCFPGETFPAHDALEDCKAVARCLPIILDKGFVELKVKEYADGDSEKPNNQLQDAARIAADAATKFAGQPNYPLGGFVPERPVNGHILSENKKDDKLPIQPAKAPQIANSQKITDSAAELLEQNEF